ncbi:MAG: glycosyltransferase family 2 protein [Solirubrobacterales bacterium]
MKPNISAGCDVVIPTAGSLDLLRPCLQSLAAQTAPHRVILVDDGPEPGVSAAIGREHPRVNVIRHPPKGGFAASVNAGIAAGDADVVVLLNDDVTPEPPFLEALLEPLRTEPSVAMVAALLLRPDGRVDSFGLEADPTLAAFPRLSGEAVEELPSESDGVLGPAGAAGAYRREAISSVGGLDEGLVSYNEDADLALRMRAAGWTCAVAPEARGVHLGSATFGHRSSPQLYRLGFSRGYMLRKYRVLNSPGRALRAISSELASIGWQIVKARDLAGLRGRIAGWRSGRPEISLPRELLSESITVADGIARRRALHGR